MLNTGSRAAINRNTISGLRSAALIAVLVIYGLISNPFIMHMVILLILFVWKNIPKATKYLMAYSTVILGAFLISSRSVGMTVSDDFPGYYNSFSANASYSMSQMVFMYWRINEVGVLIVHKIIYMTFGIITPQFLMFIHASIIGCMTIYALKRTLLSKISNRHLGIILATSLAFYPYLITTQLVRQAYAVPFILLSLNSLGKKEIFGYGIIASLFHMSSILILPIFFISKKIIQISKILFVGYIVSMFIFIRGLMFFSINSIGTLIKLNKEFIYSGEIQDLTNQSVLFAIIVLIIFGVGLGADKLRNQNSPLYHEHTFALSALLATLSLMLATVNMGYFPYRMGLFISFFYGFYISSTYRKYFNVVWAPLLIIILWRISILFRSNSGPFALWTQFKVDEIMPILSL